MKKYYYLCIAILSLGCSSKIGEANDVKCAEIYRNDYSEARFEKIQTTLNSEAVSVNELRFECVISASYTGKVTFDKFGKWDLKVDTDNKRQPILVWRNVELFSDGKRYDVYTHGIEERKHIYASVMVFQNNVDLLSQNSSQREKLKNYFSDLIKNESQAEKDFYELYWKTVDPAYWDVISKFYK